MEFLTATLSLAGPRCARSSQPASPAEILAEMDFCGVDGRWSGTRRSSTPAPRGQRSAAEAIQAQPRLFGCWAVLPNQAREFPPFADSCRNAGRARQAVRVYQRPPL